METESFNVTSVWLAAGALLLTLVSIGVAVVALVIAHRANMKAGEANDRADEANRLHREEIDILDRQHREKTDAVFTLDVRREQWEPDGPNTYPIGRIIYTFTNRGAGAATAVTITPTNINEPNPGSYGKSFVRTFDFIAPGEGVVFLVEHGWGMERMFSGDIGDRSADFVITWKTTHGDDRDRTIRHAGETAWRTVHLDAPPPGWSELEEQ